MHYPIFSTTSTQGSTCNFPQNCPRFTQNWEQKMFHTDIKRFRYQSGRYTDAQTNREANIQKYIYRERHINMDINWDIQRGIELPSFCSRLSMWSRGRGRRRRLKMPLFASKASSQSIVRVQCWCRVGKVSLQPPG